MYIYTWLLYELSFYPEDFIGWQLISMHLLPTVQHQQLGRYLDREDEVQIRTMVEKDTVNNKYSTVGLL